MKKAIVATAISLAFASTAFAAAPAMNLESGQVQLGYSYENLQTTLNGLGDLGTYHGNGYQLDYGLSNKLVLTGSYLNSDSKSFNVNIPGVYTGSLNNVGFNSTELGLQYKLSDNIALSAGSLKSEFNANGSSNSSSEMFGGIAYKQNISNNIDGYASYIKSTNVTDWKAGVTYNLNKNTSFDVGYHDYENNGASNYSAKGMSFGLNHKF